jgi:hypothetical protein
MRSSACATVTNDRSSAINIRIALELADPVID